MPDKQEKASITAIIEAVNTIKQESRKLHITADDTLNRLKVNAGKEFGKNTIIYNWIKEQIKLFNQ